MVNNKITGSTFAAVVSEDGTGTYNIIGNCFSENPIGTEVVNAGVFTSDSPPFTTNLVSNSYEHVPIRLEIITFSPGYGNRQLSGPHPRRFWKCDGDYQVIRFEAVRGFTSIPMFSNPALTHSSTRDSHKRH